jgi:molybdate transport system substrate-binding protein
MARFLAPLCALVRRLAPAGAVLAAALVPAGGPAWAEPPRPVVVFAAASLTDALKAAAAAWTAETGKEATFSFAASSALVKQIESGAPADLFASADLKWMDHAAGEGLIRPETRRALLGNALVLIAPKDAAPALTLAPGVDLLAALGPEGRLATGNPSSVPVGAYARQALTALGVWDAVAPRVAGAESVRAALLLVSRGEAPLGVVYATDALSDPGVVVVDEFPEGLHDPIVYPFAVTAASTNPDAAAFLAFLGSEAGRKAFTDRGFTTLD